MALNAFRKNLKTGTKVKNFVIDWESLHSALQHLKQRLHQRSLMKIIQIQLISFSHNMIIFELLTLSIVTAFN